MLRIFLAATIFLCILAAQTKPLPPPGIAVPDDERRALETGLRDLRAATDRLKGDPLLPDVLIFHEAVRYALQYNEFFNPKEFAAARELLRLGQERAAELAAGRHPWTTAPGLVVRGYVSRIDKSVQPYGLVVPPSYSPTAPHRWRLDAWFHGRGDMLSEVSFLSGRLKSPGEFTPPDTIVLHLYGRYCNANRFAGEVDLFEAMEDVKRNYAIDENRILVRGFSMGGAATWHIAAHHAGLWAAAAPGAGFAETLDYLKGRAQDLLEAPAWQRALLHLYDSVDYAANFYNCPIVAYNGELDRQKQAADMMEQAMLAEGIRLRRVIGPGTEHKYHPASKVEINAILDPIAERGRDPYPRKVRFTTWTLAYNRMKWVVVDALGKHWERARVDAEITGASAVDVRTVNVAGLTLEMGPGGAPLDVALRPTVTIDGQKLTAPAPFSDRSWVAHFHKSGAKWTVVESAAAPGLHKRHGLQGPIDDAFLESFIFVRPTGQPRTPKLGAWVATEQQHAIARWRSQFRGEAQVRDDRDISDADIASSNLVLWGDPSSNRILARIADRLPLKWPAQPDQALILIYPNPLNPNRYVVVNSGFTFREDANATNARQYPRLPDYAVVDITTPADDHLPGKLMSAGFFNEEWGL